MLLMILPIKLLSSLLNDNADTNVNYSPLSLYYALAVAASGAEGQTQQELLDLLGVADADTLAEQCGNLYPAALYG